MRYTIPGIEKALEGRMLRNLGGSEFVIGIDGEEHSIRILGMDSGGMEFVMDNRYHRARYLGDSTNEMRLVIDNVQVTLAMHAHFDDIVYKNSGGGDAGSAQLALKSQIPGKVVSVGVEEGGKVSQGDTVCTLESMKMQVAVKAHRDGTVKSLRVKESATVAKGDVIAEIE